MKKYKLFVLYIVIFIFTVSVFPSNLLKFTAFAQNNKIDGCIIDFNADMQTDSVIVTLTLEETQKFKSYTTQDFSDVDCIAIEDLTQSTLEYAKAKHNNLNIEENPLINLENYRRILKLTLNEDNKDNVIETVHILNRREDIHIAAPNYIYSLNSGNEDETEIDYFDEGAMWGLNGTHGIEANKAWNISTGERSIKVGVLDTGIQGDHPDLQYQLSQGLHRTFLDGQNTLDPRETLIDYDGHGTHVAGTIGAWGDDELGVRGVCSEVDLISLRALNSWGYGNSSDLVSAINYAASINIPILNLSGGVPTLHPNLQIALESYNGLFICTAGNGDENKIGVNNDIIPYYPSEYSYGYSCSGRVISVGALNADGSRTTFSNYGQNSVSIYAPGSDILSTFPVHICESICSKSDSQLNETELEIKSDHVATGYHYMSGTSMAAPHVTGVAALLKSIKYDLTAAQLKTAIINGSDVITIETPTGEAQTVKKLNAYKAVKYVLDNYVNNTTLTSNSQSFSYEINTDYYGLTAQNFLLAINAETDYSCRFTVSSTNALNLTLYDSNFYKVTFSGSTYDNGCTVIFNQFLSSGTYYLKSGYTNDGQGTIDVNITSTPHSDHDYTYRYTQGNARNHRAYCICGEYQLKPHVVRVGINGPENRCAICGALVASGGNLNGLQSTARYVTANGSFIAANGVIYLVDEDFDAYFEGTLQFYLNTNIPLIPNTVSIYGEGLFPN